MWTAQDKKYMTMVLDLAQKGYGRTWPNPMVGAVVVQKGRKVVGAGRHYRPGGPHAEIHALRQAGRRAHGATLYVNLEPCAHQGRTPPCAPAIIQAGIKRVVAAMKDPNPEVSGRGFRRLRRAGIKVEVGLLAGDAGRLNEVFIKRITTGRPFVVCKAALSLDGKIACVGGASRWISGPDARKHAHQLRALADAIIVGGRTAIKDDPELSVRLAPGVASRCPIRIILEGHDKIPADLKIFKTAEIQRVVIANGTKQPPVRKPGNQVEVWHLPGRQGRVDLEELLLRLGQAGANFVLVEGGSEVHAAFLGLGSPGRRILADRIEFILAPKLIGGRQAVGVVGGLGVEHPDRAVLLKDVSWKPLGRDMLVTATPYKT
jgi:diaminohydroxyphosphoribosylaminopyrimidine deaminase/5-amino-6-(5-phosphoribosylamino)uracil reductase